jgi:hypothetical protein
MANHIDGMGALLKRQAFLIEQARRWNAEDIDRLYAELTEVARRIVGLWSPAASLRSF